MGGYGSGRSGGRATVEGGLTLNLSKLIRDGFFRPRQSRSGSIVWTHTYSGERVGAVSYEAYLGNERGQVRLRYTSTQWGGEKHDSDYVIHLMTTPQPFGGWRWWFVCPHSGRRVAKLHLPPGAVSFASRRAYRLAYQSQRETPYDRALRRASKLQARLGNPDDDWPERPKGMRQATYDRLMNRLEAAQGVMDGHLCLLAARFLGRRSGQA